MKTKHPDFGSEKQLKTLRLSYGLSQGDLANEIGVSASVVSNYERGYRLGEWAKRQIDDWLFQQTG